jgi:hypothetical protein
MRNVVWTTVFAALDTSSGGRWTVRFDAANIFLELITLTPGLNILVRADAHLRPDAGEPLPPRAGERAVQRHADVLGEQLRPLGTYTAEFRLVDRTGQFGDSGRFFIDVATVPEVPEPSTLGLTALGVPALPRARRRTASPGGSRGSP